MVEQTSTWVAKTLESLRTSGSSGEISASVSLSLVTVVRLLYRNFGPLCHVLSFNLLASIDRVARSAGFRLVATYFHWYGADECAPRGCWRKHKIGGTHLRCNPKRLCCPSSRSPSQVSVLVLREQGQSSQPPERLRKVLGEVLLWHALVSTWFFRAQMLLEPGRCCGQFLGMILRWLPSPRHRRRYAVQCERNILMLLFRKSGELWYLLELVENDTILSILPPFLQVEGSPRHRGVRR